MRIDVEHLLENLLGFRVPLAIDQLVGLEQQAVDMVRVDLEGLGQLLGGAGAVLGREGTGEQVVKPRVLGGGLRRLPERLGRQGVVLFVQGQLGRGEIGLHEVGLLLGDDVVELVQHLARIGAAEQKEPPDGDEALRRGIAPRRSSGPACRSCPARPRRPGHDR